MDTSKSFSRYRDIKSFVHYIDPLTKLIAFLLLTIIVFVSQDVISLCSTFIFIIFISLLARVRFKTYINLFIVALPFFILMSLIYGLVTWDIKLSLILTSLMTMRLYIFLLIAIIYTSTTKELEIARSIEWIIHPLHFIKVPTYEISMMITLALRFIPILINDLFMIMRAQTSRGVNVINGTFKTKIKGIKNSMLPMFVVSFKRADDLAIAMNVRKYKIGNKRTKYWKNKFGFTEIITLVVVIAFLVVDCLYIAGVF